MVLKNTNDFVLKEIPTVSPLSREYRKFWKQQFDYCRNGYWSNGKYMPGHLYFYINFWYIELNKEKHSKHKTLGKPLLRDVEWEVGYSWMEARGFSRFSNQSETIRFEKTPKEILNTTYEEPQGHPLYENEARNLMVIASRGVGKSFWAAGMVVAHEFLFFSNSEVVVGAGDSKYSSRLLNKVKLGLANLPGAVKVGDRMYPSPFHKRFSGRWETGGQGIEAFYKKKVGGTWVTRGSGSKIKHVTFQDNHTAANGTRPSVMVMEEVGMFPNLIQAHNSSKECMMNGSVKFGSGFYLGTGGDMESGTIGAQKMFYDPSSYDMVAFDDHWEYKGNICLFLPAYKGLNDYKDAEGNTDIVSAKEYLTSTRDRLKKSKDKRVLNQELQYRPLVPSEAFLMDTSNIFPVAALKERLSKIEATPILRDASYVGELFWTENGQVSWKPSVDVRQIEDFPLTDTENAEGCIAIWEHPVINPPYGLYIAGTDPYDHDKSNTGSLGSTIIYKRFNTIDASYEWPVAEYTGRPKTAKDYYENVRKLLAYYNATCLYENEKKGMFQYFETKQCTHYLLNQPQKIKDIIKDSTVDRGKGMHMTTGLKDYGEMLIRDWLLDEFIPGQPNINKLMSIALLKELISYNDEGNFDRVMAFMMVMYHRDELHRIKVTAAEERKVDKFWTKPLFQRQRKIFI